MQRCWIFLPYLIRSLTRGCLPTIHYYSVWSHLFTWIRSFLAGRNATTTGRGKFLIYGTRHGVTTTILSKHITSALTVVKDHVIKYNETTFSNSNVNYFFVHKNSSAVIERLRLRNFQGSRVSSFDFSTLYTSLPHDLIKAKVLSLVNWCFNRE